MNLIGIDFSSSPTKKKPIAVATGIWVDKKLHIEGLESWVTFQAMADALKQRTDFLLAIDMPFGLSRELVDGLSWPGHGRTDPEAWADLMHFYTRLTRDEIVSTFKAWCNARPAGHKFAHRACDGPAGSSPSMKWVNPPVAFMLHKGVPLLLQAGVHIPGMQTGDPRRVAVEAYPGYFARQVLGRQSYKTDIPSRDSPDRRLARSELLCALEEGMLLGTPVKVRPYLRARLLEDPKADHLDAVLCCLVAAWCAQRAEQHFGLPKIVDPVEGWIAGVPEK